MMHFRKFIAKALEDYFPDELVGKEMQSKVHFQTKNNKTSFPYVVFNFLPSFTNGGQEVFLMDVDIWDNDEDTTEIERLQSAVWKDFDRVVHSDDHMQFSMYQESRYPNLDEKETGIRRRILTFQVRYFEK